MQRQFLIWILALQLQFQASAQMSYQDSLSHIFDFAHDLYLEAMDDHLHGDSVLYDLDSLKQLIYSDQKAFYSIDTAASYQILGIYDYYWEDVVGRGATSSMEGNLLLVDNRWKLVARKAAMTYTGKEIKDGFILNDPIFDSKQEAANIGPFFLERADHMNRLWTPVVSGEYLLIRKLHNYPNGNMTSFMSEQVFYFRKME